MKAEKPNLRGMNRNDFFGHMILDCRPNGWWHGRTRCSLHGFSNDGIVVGANATNDYEALEQLHDAMEGHIRWHHQQEHKAEQNAGSEVGA